MSARVSTDDLQFAAEWLRAYEGADGDEENLATASRVANWLDAQAGRRNQDRLVRRVAKRVGASPTKVRQKLRAGNVIG